MRNWSVSLLLLLTVLLDLQVLMLFGTVMPMQFVKRKNINKYRLYAIGTCTFFCALTLLKFLAYTDETSLLAFVRNYYWLLTESDVKLTWDFLLLL